MQAHSRLEDWAGRYKAPGVAELKALAVKLLQDKTRGSGRDDPAARQAVKRPSTSRRCSGDLLCRRPEAYSVTSNP